MRGCYSRAAAEREVERMYTPCGACGVMTTANSMCLAAEALGMTMPGNGCMSAVSSELLQTAYLAGKQIMKLLADGITARKIITPEAVDNAIAMTMAMAGSTNLFMHLPAIANEAGLHDRWWAHFDRASREVPQIVGASPSGRWHLQDIDRAGGSRAVLKSLMPKLNGNALTVTGKTLAENCADAQIYDPEVIRSLNNPVSQEGALYVLYGSLAPDGAMIKAAAVEDSMRKFAGPARCFDSLRQALDALNADQIRKGDVCILRYLGPKGAFGTTSYQFQKELKGRGLAHDVAIVTDGRFSGGSSGLSIGYLSPEAALGSPLALVQDGDRISIDLDQRKIDLEVPSAELEERRKNWSWKFDPAGVPPFLRLFVKNVGSLANGAIWEF